MPLDFHAEENRNTYATREASYEWGQNIREIVDPKGRRVADIGCGGGIYSAAWPDLGAHSVVGVDFSEQMLSAARERNGRIKNVSFKERRRIGNRLAGSERGYCLRTRH